MDDQDDTGLFENRKAELKAFEERMFECLFQKSDVLEADFVKRKAELSEINEIIEQRKKELALTLANLSIHTTSHYDTTIITEY